MACALDGPSQPLRQCCADELATQVGTGSKLVSALGDSLDGEVGERLVGPLLASSLHQHQVSEQGKQIARQLGLTSPAVRRFAVRFGCSSLLSDVNTDTVSRQFEAWIGDQSCVGTSANLEGAPERLKRICRETLPMLEGSTVPGKALCHTADAARERAAIHRASSLVFGAVKGGKHRLWQENIESGARAATSPEAFKRRFRALLRTSSGAGGGRMSQITEDLGGLAGVARGGAVERMNRELIGNIDNQMKQFGKMLDGANLERVERRARKKGHSETADRLNKLQQEDNKQQLMEELEKQQNKLKKIQE
jgi:hypothetical protein